MADKTQLPEDNDNEQITPENAENGNVRDSPVDGQEIFEQRFQDLMGVFGEQCEKHGVEIAIAMVVYPTPNGLSEDQAESFQQPMVYFRGEVLESFSLAAEVLRNFKASVAESLDTTPRSPQY